MGNVDTARRSNIRCYVWLLPSRGRQACYPGCGSVQGPNQYCFSCGCWCSYACEYPQFHGSQLHMGQWDCQSCQFRHLLPALPQHLDDRASTTVAPTQRGAAPCASTNCLPPSVHHVLRIHSNHHSQTRLCNRKVLQTLPPVRPPWPTVAPVHAVFQQVCIHQLVHLQLHKSTTSPHLQLSASGFTTVGCHDLRDLPKLMLQQPVATH